MDLATVLVAVLILVYAPLVLIVLRQPMVGQLALREVARQPGQTAILIAGPMIAGASIFAVQVSVDSGIAAATASDRAIWGSDDIEISGGGATFDPGLASRPRPAEALRMVA